MPINPEQICRIAHLSRIELLPDEVEETSRRINGILGLIEQLRAADTTGTEPMSHALEVVQRLREDNVTESDQRERFQMIAPEVEAGLFLVPKVIE
jgi:aspartyl-tRNA(Asn)/glutamyl-tRNA(Gln) amidotransferase subunit C